MKYLKEAASKYVEIWHLNETTFVAGKGTSESQSSSAIMKKLRNICQSPDEYVERSKSVEMDAIAIQDESILLLSYESKRTI